MELSFCRHYLHQQIKSFLYNEWWCQPSEGKAISSRHTLICWELSFVHNLFFIHVLQLYYFVILRLLANRRDWNKESKDLDTGSSVVWERERERESEREAGRENVLIINLFLSREWGACRLWPSDFILPISLVFQGKHESNLGPGALQLLPLIFNTWWVQEWGIVVWREDQGKWKNTGWGWARNLKRTKKGREKWGRERSLKTLFFRFDEIPISVHITGGRNACHWFTASDDQEHEN